MLCGKLCADAMVTLFFLQLTASSQTIASIREPKLLLSLRSTSEGSSDAEQTQLVELSADALNTAVMELERAAQAMHLTDGVQ